MFAVRHEGGSDNIQQSQETEEKIKRDVKRGVREVNEQNPFEVFVTVTDIRYTCVSK